MQGAHNVGIRWIVACLGVCLFASPCLADDETTADVLSVSLTALYAAASIADSDRYFAEQDFTSFDHFRRAHSYEAPMAPLRFQRSDAFGRMIEVRGVSLLTLSETRNSRLFFGVNSDGFLGIHLRGARDRHIEVARMPWLSRGLRWAD